MAHFVKGQGLVRTSFKSNVELRSATVDFVAGKYIINPRAGFAEGLSSVTVNDESIGKALITNPASLVSVDLPAEYTAIGPKAFDGCSNLESIYIYAGQVISISEDAIPSGCTVYVDTAFLTEYQTLHPLLTFAGFDSGYTYTIPYVEGVTPTTLTAQYISDLAEAMGDAKDSVGNVVVPSYFTDYEGESVFEAILDSFTNLASIESPWVSGNIANGLDFIFKATNITENIVLSESQKLGTFVSNIKCLVYPVGSSGGGAPAFTQGAFPNADTMKIHTYNVTFSSSYALTQFKDLHLYSSHGDWTGLWRSGWTEGGTITWHGSDENVIPNFYSNSAVFGKFIAETQTVVNYVPISRSIGNKIYAPNLVSCGFINGCTQNTKLWAPYLQTYKGGWQNAQYAGFYGKIMFDGTDLSITGTVYQNFVSRSNFNNQGIVTTLYKLFSCMQTQDVGLLNMIAVKRLFGTFSICSELPTLEGEDIKNQIGQIYYCKDDDKQYKWSGSEWVIYANGFIDNYYDSTLYTEEWFLNNTTTNDGVTKPTSTSANGRYFVRLIPIA